MLVPDDQDPAAQPSAPVSDGGQDPATQSDGQGQPGNATPQALSIDGVDYTPDQVRELAKAKADYERLTPVFTQQSQLLKDPDKLDEYLRKQFPDRFAPKADVPPDQKQVTDTLRQLGYLTKDEVTQIMQQTISQDREDAKYEATLDKLETSIDGKDGRPKFDRRDVLLHGQRKGIYDPEAAYNDLNGTALREWYAADKLGKKPKGLTTEKGGAGLQLPKDEKITFGSQAMSKAMDRILEGDGTAD